MNTDRTRGAHLGDQDSRDDAFVPPQPGTHHSSTQTATASGSARITQKNTQMKFSIPVIGPLLSLAYAHPLIAGVTAVAVVAGGGAAVTAALPDSTSSPSTALVRGFVMDQSDGQKAPTGYDFTPTPPVVAGTGTDALYLQGGYLMSTNGRLASWGSSEVPTAEGCRKEVTENPVRKTSVSVGYAMCYLDRNGDPGYITVTASDTDSVTVDTAHLG
ncbi:hypothetical protein G9272_03265 [Streptomyces asoensis]|uniref:Uncharacterized protein n=1 Tax=Streptomyces asoensis TaxID=249586 RepID=A0A6M4WNK7_9ACTN|nr:hypothetical protein [Streptomyces asoensis]QJS99445.1 hypothetical protein G9272_03265 [Streptomyces asoensis]